MNWKNKKYKIIIGVLLVHILKIVIIYIMNKDIATNFLSAILSNFLIVSGVIGLTEDTYYIPEKASFTSVKQETYYGKQNGFKQDMYILKNITTIIIGLVFFFIWV
ncbi:MAG: hypothetical protein N4A63_02685 [Vallitalea sp.]|jgi:hypothetical protein|nr:hypothetical protein [Vallitalea sp.]